MENNFQVISAAVTDRGLSEKRPQNEDSYLEMANQGIFAVADGVGGAQAGDVASQMAVEILGEAFANHPAEIDAEEVMRVAVERANGAIFQMAADLPQLSSMATTIAALHVSGNIATIGHVGDSRVYRLDSEGYLHRETADHSVVEEEVRAGRMTPEQALNHPSRNVISRALGAESAVDVEIKTIMIDPGTTFLLCSDGITRHIPDTELQDLMAAGETPAAICEQLKSICYERGAEDNLTAVIVQVSHELAGKYSTNGTGAHDTEELTVASARSPFTSTVSDDAANQPNEINTGSMQHGSTDETDEGYETISSHDTIPSLSDELDDHSYLMTEPEDTVPGTRTRESRENYSSSSVTIPAAPQSAAASTRSVAASADVKAAEGPLGKALSALMYIALGALIGAGLYYLLVPKPEPVTLPAQTPAIQETKSNNIALTSFEEGRRLVDSDPEKYINANAASAQEAEDYFLLGRAFLLTGKYWEAKRAFTEARNKLPQVVDQSNVKTLAHEIAMALAIIESSPATENFQRDIATAKAAANANTAAPGAGVNANSAQPNATNSSANDPLVPAR